MCVCVFCVSCSFHSSFHRANPPKANEHLFRWSPEIIITKKKKQIITLDSGIAFHESNEFLDEQSSPFSRWRNPVCYKAKCSRALLSKSDSRSNQIHSQKRCHLQPRTHRSNACERCWHRVWFGVSDEHQALELESTMYMAMALRVFRSRPVRSEGFSHPIATATNSTTGSLFGLTGGVFFYFSSFKSPIIAPTPAYSAVVVCGSLCW